MIFHVVYERSTHCPHSDERECTPCFKEAIAEDIGEPDFDVMWNRYLADYKTDGETAQSFTIYSEDTQGPKPPTLAEDAVRRYSP